MKKLAVLSFVLLTGCQTLVPIQREFPSVPSELAQPCPELSTVPAGTEKLSVVMSTVADNYSKYHECQLRVDLWNQWYAEQREIFNSALDHGSK